MYVLGLGRRLGQPVVEFAGHPLVPQGQQQLADPSLWLVEVRCFSGSAIPPHPGGTFRSLQKAVDQTGSTVTEQCSKLLAFRVRLRFVRHTIGR